MNRIGERSFKSPVLFVLDKEIGEIFKTCEEQGYVLMVTADHGNAEQMFAENGGPHTAHTTNRGERLTNFYEFSCLSSLNLLIMQASSLML